MVWNLFLDGTRILFLGTMVLYFTYAVTALRTKGLHYHFRFNPRDPARSTGRSLVWLGVRASSIMLAGLSAVLNVL